MADKELDKMKLATMLNSTPSSGGLNATNTRTPSFVDPSSRLSLALDEWRRGNAPAAYLLRGDPQGLINELTTPKPVPTTEQSLQDMYNFAVGSIAPIEGGAESSFSSKLNLKPRISADKLKGPDLQPARNFINQSKSLPGVTKEGHDFGTKVAKLIDPDTVMAKEDFVKNLRPNQYRKIDMESTAANAYAHYRQEAEDNFGSYLSDAHLEHAGVPDEHSPHIFETLTNRQHSLDNDPEIIQQNKELFNEMPKSTREYLKKEGVSNVDELDSWYDHLVHENIDDYIQYAYSTGEMDYDINAGGYRYKGIQRLVPQELTGNKYFEIGVTHPNQEGIPYKHYDAPEDPNGLIGHVRGSIITEPTPVTTGSRSKFWAKPGDTIIEEVQADAQKTADQVDHLHQVHGTVTKAGIQHALENGSRTVYVPTSRAIGAGERGSPGGEFASIYDSQVMNEAVNPLKDMEGVKYTPPTQTPYSHPWTRFQYEDALNVLGIPKSQHAPADLYTIRDDRPWFDKEKYENMNPRQEILNNIDKHQKALEREKRLQENVTPVATSTFTPADYNKRIVDIQKSLDANQNYLKWMDEKFPGDVSTQKSSFNDAIKQVLDKRNTEIQNIQQSTNEMPYHKLEFTDEAANNIINGEGQSLPGYKKGGVVKMAGGGSPSDTVEAGTPMAKAMGTYPFQQSEAPLEAPMFSPDDLIGTGIPTAASKAILALGLKDAAKEALMSSGSFFKNMFTKPEDIAAYKNEFTHGFYHGTPNPKNILAEGGFDDRIAFVTPNPKFANRFAGSEVGGVNRAGEPTAPTVLPLSVRLGKVFEPKTPDAKQLLNEYAEFVKNDLPLSKKSQNAMYNGKWEHIEEDRDFLDFLKDKGYDSFGVYENGQKNYGIFDQSRIRSPFAKFDPSEANSTDLLKAEGGSVKKIDTKSKNSDIMHQSLAQMRAEILRRKHG